MIVDGKGNLFENRRKNKEDRRKNEIDVSGGRRKEDRRKSSQIPETENKNIPCQWGRRFLTKSPSPLIALT